MLYAGRVFLAVLVAVASAVALPNHLKAVALDAVPVIQGTSVSASFGGYSAKAGLGGSVQGGPQGGLYAAAESPVGSAGTGLGGTVPGGQKPSVHYAEGSSGVDQGSSASHEGGAHASAPSPPGHSGGHKPVPHQQGSTGFDSIFNIPISVLQAVNSYLNNRGPVTKPVHRRRGHKPRPGPVTRPVHRRRGHRPRPGQGEEQDVVYKTVTPVRGEGPGAEGPGPEGPPGAPVENVPAGPPPVGAPQGHTVIQKRVNYDDIFNIPISALKSVNDLLNGGVKSH